MPPLSRCPRCLPPELDSAVRQLAAAWAASPIRPRVLPSVSRQWTDLLAQWADEPALPVFVRKGSVCRGQVVIHASGRALIPSDNSPAVWAYTLALRGECPAIMQIREAVAADKIPVAFTGLGTFGELNAAGWKLAHVQKLGLNRRGSLEDLPWGMLRDHFCKFLSPANMFVVPKGWAGLGEVPEVIEAIRLGSGQGSA